MSRVWVLRNPVTFPIEVSCISLDKYEARFPAIPNCFAKGGDTDEAILNLSKVIQAKLEAK